MTTQLAKVEVEDFSVCFGKDAVLQHLNLQVFTGERLAIIGPTGSGKTTFLRSLNRLNDLTPGFSSSGRILLDGKNITSPDTDVAHLRRRIGLVKLTALPLPCSIFENIAVALRLAGHSERQELQDRVTASLQRVRLWPEVKDRLRDPALNLPSEQQQLLCLARVLALEPEVLLLDEPCAGLDPLSTGKIEDLLREMQANLAIVLVTNDNQQAARASDRTAFFLAGRLVECGPTEQLFFNPTQPQTSDFITGRF